MNTPFQPTTLSHPVSIMKKTPATLSDIFTCARCGSCCQGETTVSLDQDDQERMIAELGLTRQEVEEKYWRVTGKVVQMKIVDHHCIFTQRTPVVPYTWVGLGGAGNGRSIPVS